MVQQRFRIRFSKQGDLRLVSHRDLARTLERLFRRVGLNVCQSEGFHPKPRMMFPSALALGVAGLDEVLEVDLQEDITPDDLLPRLVAQAPPGLAFHHIERVPAGTKKVLAASQTFAVPIPPERCEGLYQRIDALMACDHYPIEREGRAEPIDLRAFVQELSLDGSVLRIKLRIANEAAARSSDVLAALGLADVVDVGWPMTRTTVELAS